jgi:hypothetical protein
MLLLLATDGSYSAVTPTPLGCTAGFQFAASLQNPPLAPIQTAVIAGFDGVTVAALAVAVSYFSSTGVTRLATP